MVISTNRIKTFPVQSELQSFILPPTTTLSVSSPTNHSSSTLANQDSAFWNKLRIWKPHLHRQTKWGSGVENSLYINQPSSSSESKLSLSIKNWKLYFLAGTETSKICLWTRTKQSCLAGEGSRPQATWQLFCITITVSCLYWLKFSFFTTPQIGDSFWHWIGTNNHLLTKMIQYFYNLHSTCAYIYYWVHLLIDFHLLIKSFLEANQNYHYFTK